MGGDGDPELHRQRVEVINTTWGKGLDIAYLGHGDFALSEDLKKKNSLPAQPGNTELIKFAIDKSLELWPDLIYWVKVDDLTYMVPQNLNRYLASRGADGTTEIAMLGRRLMTVPGGDVFCSGGAGYVLTRGAINYIGQHWTEDACAGRGWFQNQGDIALAKCLPQGSLIDTRDTGTPSSRATTGDSDSRGGGGGSERFHSYGPKRLMSGDVDQWYKDYTKKWYIIRGGLACCSKQLVSFHYVEYGEMAAIYRIFTEREKFVAMSDRERVASYPKPGRSLSYYAGGSPGQNDAMWDLLLKHVDW